MNTVDPGLGTTDKDDCIDHCLSHKDLILQKDHLINILIPRISFVYYC